MRRLRRLKPLCDDIFGIFGEFHLDDIFSIFGASQVVLLKQRLCVLFTAVDDDQMMQRSRRLSLIIWHSCPF